MTEPAKIFNRGPRVREIAKLPWINRIRPPVFKALAIYVQMSSAQPLSIRICMGRSVNIQSYQHDHFSRPRLKFALGQAQHSTPYIKQEPLTRIIANQLICIVGSWRDGDGAWINKTLPHTHKSICFCLCQYLLYPPISAPPTAWRQASASPRSP